MIPVFVALIGLQACQDDDSFSTSSANRLTFSVDTVMLDTVFSRIPSHTRTFWVFNHSGDGIRCASVSLLKGNQTGFRVNVDGIYLGAVEGYHTNDVEVRKKDSLRVFVELTAPMNNQSEPQLLEDFLVFRLESGVEQRVCLQAQTWDALLVNNLEVSRDTTINTTRPVVISGGIKVDSTATLNLRGTTLYFGSDAGIDVYGRLTCDSHDGRETVLRGSRLDHMFDYLPYDRVSGQWKGIRIHDSSFGNEIRHTDIHSGTDAIVCDSSDASRSKLVLEYSTIHNMQGYGLMAKNCSISVNTCQISNTLNDCVAIYGGNVSISNSTLAQFYPFDSNRGAALRLANIFDAKPYPLQQFVGVNNLITGYADDVLMGEQGDIAVAFSYQFDYCILRTPKVETADSVRFTNIIWENPEDTIVTGKKNFAKIDEDNLIYDFRLSEVSKAIGAANKTVALPTDRFGLLRDEEPDIGCYERMK